MLHSSCGLPYRNRFMEEARKSPSCNNSEKDRISDLPVSLIHHILSFLDTNCVVQTSVLSKRWSPVWISLPFLNLSCIINKPPHSRRHSAVDYSALVTQFGRFINFVDQVFILHDNSDIIRNSLILSSQAFPLLELSVVDSTIPDDNNMVFTVDSRDLKSFTLMVLADETMASIIKLSAPSLISLVCRDFMTQDYSLENLDSLVTADITMILTEEEDDETIETYLELSAEEKLMFGERMMKFLGALHNAKQLRFSRMMPAYSSANLVNICNLQYLDLKMWFTRGCLRAIAYLLEISPNLKSLVLVSKEVNLAEVGYDWDVGLRLPSILSHLKYVEVKELQGCDNEVELLQLVLKKATVLEEVALFFRSTAVHLVE